MAKAFIKLLDSDAAISNAILVALAKEIGDSVTHSAKQLETSIRRVVREAIMNSPEISSLSNGDLRHDFGIPVGVDVATPIVNAIADSVTVRASKIKVVGKSLSGGLTIAIQPDDYSDLLSLPIAVVETAKGATLPWLHWLLNRGDSIIVADFGVKYGAGLGRSGGAAMRAKLRPFKVNTQFAGTSSDNFITRALERHQKRIEDAVRRNI